MEMHEIIRQRRAQLGLSGADLAQKAGVDPRQLRRYESGETEPTIGVAKKLAAALGMSLDALTGNDVNLIDLSGDWWACWQSWQNDQERATPHQIRMTQRGDHIDVVAVTRGTAVEDGGYLWRGELRIFDNEALIGWYVADEGATRSKGSMYFSLHPHGRQATGRWAGLSHDGPIVSGWAALAHSEDEVAAIMAELHTRDVRTGR